MAPAPIHAPSSIVIGATSRPENLIVDPSSGIRCPALMICAPWAIITSSPMVTPPWVSSIADLPIETSEPMASFR